jgi:uncharacterized membrane protein
MISYLQATNASKGLFHAHFLFLFGLFSYLVIIWVICLFYQVVIVLLVVYWKGIGGCLHGNYFVTIWVTDECSLFIALPNHSCHASVGLSLVAYS